MRWDGVAAEWRARDDASLAAVVRRVEQELAAAPAQQTFITPVERRSAKWSMSGGYHG